MTDGSEGAAAYPNPLTIASRLRRDDLADVDPRTREAECLWCEKVTDHVPGPVTEIGEGEASIHWWTCVECSEGRTLL